MTDELFNEMKSGKYFKRRSKSYKKLFALYEYQRPLESLKVDPLVDFEGE